MCEFNVYLQRSNGKEKVGENVVYSKLDDNGLVVRDMLGAFMILEDMIIEEVSVENERMVLKEHPLLKELISFLSAYGCSEQDRKTVSEVERRWVALKEKGDALVNRMKERI